MSLMQGKAQWLAVMPFVVLMVTGEVSAKPLRNAPDQKPCEWIVVNGSGRPSPNCLNESDIKPCEALLAKTLPGAIERLKRELQRNLDGDDKLRAGWFQRDLDELNGPSPLLAYALQSPPYNPLYDLKHTKDFIKNAKKNIAILQSGDEEKMSEVIGVPYRGKALEERLAGDEEFMCMLNVRLAQLTGKPLAKTERAASGGASAAPSGSPKSSSQDTPVTPAPAGQAGSTQTAERTLAALGALAGNSPQKALNLLTPALTAAIGRNPNIVKALAGLNALNANSIQEALAILKPLLTDAAKKNPSSSKALAGLNALTADAPEDAVAVLITILAGSASKNPNVAKTLASLEALPANIATVDAEGGTADNGNPT